MARKLEDIKLKEISLVSSPANRKKFFVIKEQKCPECGGILKQQRIDEDGKSCTQLKCSECGEIYKNSNEEESVKMKDFNELFKGVTDEDITEEYEKIFKSLSDEVKTAMEGALTLFNKYKEDIPKDLWDAIGVISKHAIGTYSHPVKKEEEVLNLLLEKYKKEIENYLEHGSWKYRHELFGLRMDIKVKLMWIEGQIPNLKLALTKINKS